METSVSLRSRTKDTHMTTAVRFFILALLIATPAAAQSTPPASAPTYPTVKVGMLSYLQYDAELKNRDGFNAFDITRGYINVTGQLSPNVKFRFTPDVKRVTDGSLAGSLTVRVKYGFLEFDNLLGKKSWLRVGDSQTPWIDFEEHINRYRVQGLVFAEREGLLPSSGDFGVGYLTPVGGDYGEMHVGVYNGEGATQAEANKYKSVQGRVTIRPFPHAGLAKGLRVSGFYNAGWYAANRPRRTGIIAGHFEHQRLVVLLQRVMATERPTVTTPANIDRSGTSIFTEVRQGMQGWAGWVRYERFDPDTAIRNNGHQRTIAAIAYWMKLTGGANVGIVFNNEDVRYESRDPRPHENRFLAQLHVEF